MTSHFKEFPALRRHGFVPARALRLKNKIVSAAEALVIVHDCDTVACSGFVGSGHPGRTDHCAGGRFVETVGKKVHLVVNYDDVAIDPQVADTYAAMIRYMDLNYYTPATRYTTICVSTLEAGRVA